MSFNPKAPIKTQNSSIGLRKISETKIAETETLEKVGKDPTKTKKSIRFDQDTKEEPKLQVSSDKPAPLRTKTVWDDDDLGE